VSALPAEDTRPLTDDERKLLNRLLSDPTVYPLTFKNWLIPFLEASDMDLPVLAVHGLADRLVQAVQLDTSTGAASVQLRVGASFTVLDSTGAPIFRVDEDGDLHGKTGKALTFDL
jgi:hypothetical protein